MANNTPHQIVIVGGGASGLDVTSIDAGSYAAMQPFVQDGTFSDVSQPFAICPSLAIEMMQQPGAESFASDLMQGMDVQSAALDVQQAECMQVSDFPIFQE